VTQFKTNNPIKAKEDHVMTTSTTKNTSQGIFLPIDRTRRILPFRVKVAIIILIILGTIAPTWAGIWSFVGVITEVDKSATAPAKWGYGIGPKAVVWVIWSDSQHGRGGGYICVNLSRNFQAT
jgi:hypothetical protein